MSNSARKKERHRIKRKQKQAQLRRQRNQSPFVALKRSSGPIECYMNGDWHFMRQASVMVLRELGSGRHIVAAFLVDLGVLGLKEAWGRLDVSPKEFHEEIIAGMNAGTTMRPVELEAAQRMVAGGIRFARDNGFRLPRGYEKWLRVLGDVDWQNADTSDFIMEFAGTLEELRTRLIVSTPEEYLQRTDLSFLIRDGDFPLVFEDLDDEDEEEVLDEREVLQGALELLRERGVDAVRRWCFANKEAVHPRLAEALELFLDASAMLAVEDGGGADGGGDGDVDGDVNEAAGNPFEALLELYKPEDRESLGEAIDQLSRFVESFKNEDEFADSIIPEEPEAREQME